MASDTPLIAVVDDDVSVGVGVQRLLSSAGFRVTTFTSGVEFLASIDATPPDCIVLDVRMPVMNGLDVQSRMHAIGCTRPVILISAEAEVEQRREALAAGAFAFLQKPFDGQALIDTIAAAMRGQ